MKHSVVLTVLMATLIGVLASLALRAAVSGSRPTGVVALNTYFSVLDPKTSPPGEYPYFHEHRLMVGNRPARLEAIVGPYAPLRSDDHVTQFQKWSSDGRYALIEEGVRSRKWFAVWLHDELQDTWTLMTDNLCDDGGGRGFLCQGPMFWPNGQVSFFRSPWDKGSDQVVYSLAVPVQPGKNTATQRPLPYEHHLHDIAPSPPPHEDYLALSAYENSQLKVHIFEMDQHANVSVKSDCRVHTPDSELLQSTGTMWSPDGEWLSFVAKRADNTLLSVWVVSRQNILASCAKVGKTVDAKKLTAVSVAQLHNNDFGRTWVAWSANSQWVFYANLDKQDNAQIYRIHPDGTGSEALTSDDEWKYFPASTPDDNWVSYVAYDGKARNLKAANVTSKRVVTLTSLRPDMGIDEVIAWKPQPKQ